MEIVRTKTTARGGITPEEEIKLKAHADMWIARAMRTAPIEPDKIIPAIKRLYAVAGLEEPRVTIAPSPLVMAFAYGAASAIWHSRKDGMTDDTTRATTEATTYDATCAATYYATRGATDPATGDAIYATTYVATHAATRAATDAANYYTTRAVAATATRGTTLAAASEATPAAIANATSAAIYALTYNAVYTATFEATHGTIHDAIRVAVRVATDNPIPTAARGAMAACIALAGDFGVSRARHWSSVAQSGNTFAPMECYLTAWRDVIGLNLSVYKKYDAWEECAIHGGLRVMHPNFCIVSDFPEILRVDDQNMPHCADGPSHRWRDGWELYHWHGQRVPKNWIVDRNKISVAEIFKLENAEQRRAGCEIIGWDRVLSGIDATLIDDDGDPQIGTLYEGEIPGAVKCGFLKVLCGTGRTFVIPVPAGLPNAIAAQAWIQDIPVKKWAAPEVRG